MENEKNNKKGLVTLIVGIGILFALIFSATFAYFSVTSTNNFGSSTIDATAESIGTVTLNGTSSNLRLDLSAVDMMKGASDITYWGTSDGTPSTTQNVVTIGNTQVTGAGYFNCNYTLNVTATGTNNMYTAFQGMSGKSTEQIVLKIGDTKYDFNTASLFPITINGALNGVTSSDVKSLTAEFYLVNKESVNQDALKGTDITITISATSFSCSIGTPPPPAAESLIELAKTDNTIVKYTGKVTDRYQDYGLGVDATKVYSFTSNNINNVIFENYCWKIIRTTETGGVKLLYNGEPTTNATTAKQECNNTGDDAMLTAAQMGTDSNYIKYNTSNAYPSRVGYMYSADGIDNTYYDDLWSDTVNTNDSLIKEKIEYWFANSGINENKLENAVFCNDRSLASNSPVVEADLATSSTTVMLTVYFKNYNALTTLECTYQADAFSKDNPKAQTNYKVGLMSSPEARLMTVATFNNTKIYWTSSPSSFSTAGDQVIYLNSYYPDERGIGSPAGVRPVVSANSGVQITDGDGSTTNPFIFE